MKAFNTCLTFTIIVFLTGSCVSNKKKTKVSRHSKNTKVVKLQSVQKKLDCSPILVSDWAQTSNLDTQEIAITSKISFVRDDKKTKKGVLKIIKNKNELCQISLSNKPELYLSNEDQSFYILNKANKTSSAYQIRRQRCEFLGLSKIGPYELKQFQQWKNSNKSTCKEYK